MTILFPNEQTRRTVIAAIGQNKNVAWTFAGNLIAFAGTTQTLINRNQGVPALAIPLDDPNLAFDYVVLNGTTGLAATQGLVSTEVTDDGTAQNLAPTI